MNAAGPDVPITLGIVALLMAFFIWNRIPAVIVAVCAALALHFTGVLTTQQLLAGFGDPVVILLVALFSIAVALESSGVAAWAGRMLLRATRGRAALRLVAIMLVAAVLSGLMGMNGTVAAMLPVVLMVAVQGRESPSRLLIPLSFACLAGAQLTMLGSPANVITTTEIAAAGVGRIGFLDWAVLGVPQVVGTIAFTALLGGRLIPEREPAAVASGDAPADPLGARGWIALGILALLVVLLVFNVTTPAVAAMSCAVLMVLTRVVAVPELVRGVDWSTCVLVGAMIAPAVAMSTSGAARLIGDQVVEALGGFGPVAVLAGLFLVTMLLSQFISNTSAVLVMLPIGLATATDLGVSAVPMMLGVAMGASASFLTPISNPVHLVVYGPGGYRFGDFWRLGLVLTAWTLAVTLVVVPLVWRF